MQRIAVVMYSLLVALVLNGCATSGATPQEKTPDDPLHET